MRSRLRWTLFAALAGLAVIGLVGSAVTAAAPRRSTSRPPSSASAPAAHQAASALAGLPASSEPTIKTREIVNGKTGGEVPPPPTDVMGSPADSTLVRSDDLYMTQIKNGFTVNRWAKLDGLALGPQGPISTVDNSADIIPPLANPDYPTVSGRFRDIESDRVLAFRRFALAKQTILTLSSTNDTAEPEWSGKRDAVRPCREAGQTCTFSVPAPHVGYSFIGTARYAENQPTPYPLPVSTGSGDGARGMSGHSDTGYNAAGMNQEFTLVGSGRSDEYVELRVRSTGLCLQVVGSAPGPGSRLETALCPSDPAPQQLWKVVPQTSSPQEVRIHSKVANLMIVRDCNCLPSTGLKLAPATDTSVLGVFFAQASGEPGGAIPTWSTSSSGGPQAPFAVAAGDLDRAVDAAGNYHDEAVVAYTDAERHLQVRVIDYNANADHLHVTAPNIPLPETGKLFDGIWRPGSVGVAVGDFDGDDLNEIAVTWQAADGRFHVTFLRYAAPAGGGRTLTVVGEPAGITLFQDFKEFPSFSSGYASTIAGEFDRDGHADLAIGFAASTKSYTWNTMSGYLGVATFTSDLRLRGEKTLRASGPGDLLNTSSSDLSMTTHGLKLVPGLFKFDPDHGFTFQRREIAMAWSQPQFDALAIFDVQPAPDCTAQACALTISSQVTVPLMPGFDTGRSAVKLPLSLAAGGFAGRGTGADPPLWGVVLALPPRPGAAGRVYLFDVATTRLGVAQPIDGNSQYVLTAYDRDGRSLAVGAPLVLTVNKLVRSTLVAAQPPAHADWLDGHFVNVSRTGDFDVQMGSSSTTEYKFDSSTKSGWNFGVSQGASVAASFKAGVGDNNVAGSFEVKEKFSKNWSHASTDFNKYSTKITTAVTVTGKDDDIVQGSYVTYYVYRYPILGLPAKKPDGSPCKECLPFYEVTIPGQVIPTNGYGRALAWYQPGWENGNALSYPKLVDGNVRIPDLGSYQYVDDHGKTVAVTQPLLNTVNSVGGGKTTAKLQITGQTGSGNTTTDANSWKLGVENSGSASVSGDVGVVKAKATVKLSLGVDGGNSFSHTETGSTTSTSGSSFLLTIPAIDSNKGYTVGTAYYYDRAGVPKVIHGVDLTSSAGSSEFWRRYYGQAPDPALNLPDATFLTYDEAGELKAPKFSTLATRQLIRGFSALQPEDPSSPVTSGQPYATDPVAGDKVTFAVQLHDYSLVDSPPVPVEFYAVPVNAAGLGVTGAPQPIGTVTSLAIPSQGMVTVKSPQWTAIANGQGAQDWRIFAVVDPADSVHEIHPWKGGKPCPKESLDEEAPPGTVVDERMVDPMTGKPEELACGQNNQGYGTITVMPKAGTPAAASEVVSERGVMRPARRGRRPALGPAEPAGARLSGFGLADGNRHQLRLRHGARIPSVRLGEAVMGLIYTRASVSTPAIQPVLVYDGPPSAGHLIASALQDGAARRGGGDAQFVWRPTTPGLHTLYELMVGATPGANSRQTMKIYVLPRRAHARTPAKNTCPRHTTRGRACPRRPKPPMTIVALRLRSRARTAWRTRRTLRGIPSWTFSHLSVAGHLDAAKWYSTTGIDGVWRSGPPAPPDPRTNQLPLDLNIIDFP